MRMKERRERVRRAITEANQATYLRHGRRVGGVDCGGGVGRIGGTGLG